MTTRTIKTKKALDMIVCKWLQQMENAHFRCVSHFHFDVVSGDQFYTVYDPATDQCLTVWLAQDHFGNQALELAKGILASKLNGKGGKG